MRFLGEIPVNLLTTTKPIASGLFIILMFSMTAFAECEIDSGDSYDLGRDIGVRVGIGEIPIPDNMSLVAFGEQTDITDAKWAMARFAVLDGDQPKLSLIVVLESIEPDEQYEGSQQFVGKTCTTLREGYSITLADRAEGIPPIGVLSGKGIFIKAFGEDAHSYISQLFEGAGREF